MDKKESIHVKATLSKMPLCNRQSSKLGTRTAFPFGPRQSNMCPRVFALRSKLYQSSEHGMRLARPFGARRVGACTPKEVASSPRATVTDPNDKGE